MEGGPLACSGMDCKRLGFEVIRIKMLLKRRGIRGMLGFVFELLGIVSFIILKAWHIMRELCQRE